MFIYVDPWLSNQGDEEASRKWHISREKIKDWVQKGMAWIRHGETKGSVWSLSSALLLLYIWGKLPEQSQLVAVCQFLFSVARWNLFPPHTHTLSASVKQLPARIPKEGYTLQVQTLLQHLWKVFMLNKHAISRSNLYEVIPEINATKQTIHDEYLPQGQKIPEFDWNTLHKGNKKKNSQAHISTMPYTMLIFSWIL